ncbi:hypothetical protein ACRASX_15670 [Flavobacterium sp. TMP13]|uniref:hypothetical protein n=1 Tax=unclassified Flavobacterium TaxID=196869 RepID=UPI00076D1015|nr:hypothetical protein [Flavobacterium sp. TAB 87]KVV16395.1 hypothetical protein AP058_00073 [Flavobacterium sp. TAB 87]
MGKLVKKSREVKELVSDTTRTKIIEQWRFSKLNSISQIAIEFDLKETTINTIIDNYLSNKTPT